MEFFHPYPKFHIGGKQTRKSVKKYQAIFCCLGTGDSPRTDLASISIYKLLTGEKQAVSNSNFGNAPRFEGSQTINGLVRRVKRFRLCIKAPDRDNLAAFFVASLSARNLCQKSNRVRV